MSVYAYILFCLSRKFYFLSGYVRIDQWGNPTIFIKNKGRKQTQNPQEQKQQPPN